MQSSTTQTPNTSETTHLEPASDPSSIPAFNGDTLQVVIETPAGSRNKYAYDHSRRVLVLRKALPAGMVFPYDFGFVPSTLAEDGDPIDVLVLMDDPAFAGCVLDARLIGVIQGEDRNDGEEPQRNDRLLAVAAASHTQADVHAASDLPRGLLDQLQDFFANYPRVLSDKTYKLLGIEGPEHARTLVEEAQRRFASNRSGGRE